MLVLNNTSVTLYESYYCIHPGESIDCPNRFNRIHIYSQKVGECVIYQKNNKISIMNYGNLVAEIKRDKNYNKMIEITESW